MGFTNGTGPEGLPIFNKNPQTVPDLTRLRDLIRERGNRFKGTTGERDAFTNAGFAVEGHEWFDTTMGCLLIRRGSAWKRDVSFRTFTLARGGMTDNTAFFQVPTEDTAKDSEPAFLYSYDGASGKLTPEAGIYLLHAKGHPGSVATGASFIQIRSSATAVGLLARASVSVNSDPWMACTALFRADGTEGFITEIQKVTGGAHGSFGILNVTKLTTI